VNEARHATFGMLVLLAVVALALALELAQR
jgi:hypothetical protein